MLKMINQSVVFILELAMISSLAYYGYSKGTGPVLKYVLAVIYPLVAIITWSYWAAPKSEHRLAMPYVAIFRLSLFLLASYLLYRIDHTRMAIIFAVISITTQVLSLFLEGNESN